ncbi:MAG: tetratricopeptide repeat protein [Thaumarchaeota archaeon]|nr:tetratricopeptide repeat protein [Nitrososphaerota archaeon]
MAESHRRLAAIMFTDIAGYTRLAQANEALALQLLEEHRSLIRPVFSSHGGKEVKTIGDAFLIEFRSALDAVLCAVEVQEKLRDRNLSVQSSRKVELRVGVHLGDVVHGSGDIYGDAVNVSSRIEPLAEPGGIRISQQVYDHVRNKTDLTITKVGEIELKNVELPLGVYRVELPGTFSAQNEAPRERLAVLPFVNISPDPNDEYFADGLTEELISKLSEVGQLKVIARTSVMNYKKKEKKISDIGRELAVGSIIDGSVRKAGNKIRVTVQLIDARTEEHLWASNYDKELDDIFAIQSDVASKVAGSISTGVFAKGPEKDTDDIEAYTLYMRAKQLIHQSTEPSLREAIPLLESAVARDPSFSRAYSAMAQGWMKIAAGGYEPFEVVFTKGEPAARKALELGPDRAESHAAMAGIHSSIDRYAEATAEAEKAIRINPNLEDAYVFLGIQYGGAGNLDKALATFQKAYDLDPLSFGASNFLALILRVMGRFDESIKVLQRALEYNPRHPRILAGLAEAYMLKGDFAKAQEFIDAVFKINPDEPLAIMDQGLLYAFTGRREAAERELGVLKRSASDSVQLFGGLFINSALGNYDEAFRALGKQAEAHSWPFLIKSLQVFEGLRKDPRFRDFCLKVGIPP